jgi:hypothetical protein
MQVAKREMVRVLDRSGNAMVVWFSSKENMR